MTLMTLIRHRPQTEHHLTVDVQLTMSAPKLTDSQSIHSSLAPDQQPKQQQYTFITGAR